MGRLLPVLAVLLVLVGLLAPFTASPATAHGMEHGPGAVASMAAGTHAAPAGPCRSLGRHQHPCTHCPGCCPGGVCSMEQAWLPGPILALPGPTRLAEAGYGRAMASGAPGRMGAPALRPPQGRG